MQQSEVGAGRELQAVSGACLRGADEQWRSGAAPGPGRSRKVGAGRLGKATAVVGEGARAGRARTVGATRVASTKGQRVEKGLEVVGDLEDQRRTCRAGSTRRVIAREETLVNFGTVERRAPGNGTWAKFCYEIFIH